MIVGARLLVLALVTAASAVTKATDPVQYDYAMNCQGCHLPSGEGYPDRGVPSFSKDLGKFLHLEGGREFLIRVPGSAQSDLDDERLTAVINWVLTSFCAEQLPDNFQPYSVEEVARLRRLPLIDVKGTREALLERIEKRSL